MKQCSKFVGLNTHQETIAVVVSEARGGSTRYDGEIASTPKAIAKLVKALTARGRPWRFVTRSVRMINPAIV